MELRPQAYEVLRLLAFNAGRLVTKEELLASIWPGLVVTDDSLVQAISDVRHALGEAGHRVVKTIPRRGYMLVGDVASASSSTVADVPAQPASKLQPEHSNYRLVLLLVGGLVHLITHKSLLPYKREFRRRNPSPFADQSRWF